MVEMPIPHWPYRFHPNERMSPESVVRTVWRSPHATLLT